jgi:hypothetical protein
MPQSFLPSKSMLKQVVSFTKIVLHKTLLQLCLRWNQNSKYKRRLSMLLLYKSHIAVVCSKISQTTKQKQINHKKKESVTNKSECFCEDTASNEVACF